MKTKEEIIENLTNQIKFERYPPQVTSGGQSVGVPLNQGVKLTCPETDFSVTVTYHRSQLQNRELALKLYKQFLEDVIK
jgi:protein subunit release factor B